MISSLSITNRIRSRTLKKMNKHTLFANKEKVIVNNFAPDTDSVVIHTDNLSIGISRLEDGSVVISIDAVKADNQFEIAEFILGEE
jgi:hypothetical protein